MERMCKMNTFFGPIKELAGYDEISSMLDIQGKTAMISGCIDSEKAHLVSALGSQKNVRIMITYDEAKAREIYDDCRFYHKETYYYPAKDFIFYSADVHGNEIVRERLKVVKGIIENQNMTIVTTIDGCADMLLPVEVIKKNILTFETGGVVDVEKLKKQMVRLGYERMGQVDTPGQFAIRGGIIDIFPLTDEVPVRIELWDDEVDSIRTFDVESQRSIEELDKVLVYPATEYVLTQDQIDNGILAMKDEMESQIEKLENGEAKLRLMRAVEEFDESTDCSRFIHSFTDTFVSFVDYFDRDTTLFVLDEPNRLKEKMDLVEFEFSDSMENRLVNGYILPSQSNMLYSVKEIYAKICCRKTLVLTTLEYKPALIDVEESFRVEAKGISSYNNRFEFLVEDLKRYKRGKYKAIVVSNSRTRAQRLAADLREYELNAYFSEDFSKEVVAGEILVTYGNIHKGFEYPLIKFVIIAETDIFGQEKKKVAKKKKKYEGKAIAGFNELSVGDYVVHENHGLGIYRGIEKVTVDKIEKDYIKIEYASGGNLYILATQLDMLQKYSGPDARKPKLNKIGGQEWNKTKAKVHGAVEAVAKDLVELYAKRQNEAGYQFRKDTVWQKEFEEMFPYEETDDQVSAIEDTKKDMESKKIMDRLICGDVGFGKTEVAIRAAFKAVQEGKQVAYLVPTTILAQQHFNTFEQRMKNFPIKVALLSRFKTAKEVREILADLKKGFVDIVVGTHKLLSKDVVFKDLGLLIVDEEQRFGVTHKEKIKKMKENVDVLTLSATPIPRTLHMSLVGIRDMSVLEEPPVDRLPIQTFVTEHNDEMIRESINRELGRDGQVYYVYNRVKQIEDVADHIRELVPDATVAYAHGQMDEHTLEGIMYDFINGNIDVLVSTTIIETGLDISNVNTMIIEDADKLGLSQLYQLRGRVGRSNRTSYAFLLYRRDKMLKEVAEKRLHAIREFTDLGSGFKIAMKDLEIRGAGNVLGQRQHGHMEAVGYDLYCKMLNEAVNELKGIKNVNQFETTVDMDVDAFIPAKYIRSEFQKLDIYKRVAGIDTYEELMDMQDELMDRFGDLPKSALNLLKIALIKSMAHHIGAIEVKGKTAGNNWLTVIKMYEKAEINAEKIPQFVEKYGRELKFTVDKEPFFSYTINRKTYKDAESYLDAVRKLLEDMQQTLALKEEISAE